MGIPHALFEEKLDALKKAEGAKEDTELTAAHLKELVAQYKGVYVEAKGEQFPTGEILISSSRTILGCPCENLIGSVVCGLWSN